MTILHFTAIYAEYHRNYYNGIIIITIHNPKMYFVIRNCLDVFHVLSVYEVNIIL